MSLAEERATVEPLDQEDVFPPVIHNMIAVGESIGAVVTIHDD